MSYQTDTEDTICGFYAAGASDSLISDYEAIINGESGLSQAELHAKQKRDLLANHQRNRCRVPIEVATTPNGGVFVGGVLASDRQEAVVLRSDLHRAGARCERYEGGDVDQFEVTSFSPHAKDAWPDLLRQLLLDIGYVDIRRVDVVWPSEPVEAPRL
ncbi:hypothetical protein ACVXZ4_08345 [Lacisediminihabitans sp. FW035]